MSVDLGTFRGLVTAVLLVAFVGLWIWAFSRKRRTDFDRAARLPLEENQPTADRGGEVDR